jgi:phosphoribosylanthranilate isomerase
MLAGGLTPENVGEAIAMVQPFAVDVSSGVERQRGVKDAELIQQFCRAVTRADQPATGGADRRRRPE